MIFILLVVSLAPLNFALTVHIWNDTGKPANPHQYPWMVSLKMNKPEVFRAKYGHYKPGFKPTAIPVYSHGCGGSLLQIPGNEIASDIVLTACHCIANLREKEYFNTTLFKLAIGNHRHDEKEFEEQERNISQMECLPPNTLDDDIAIIKLDSPVRFTASINYISLPRKNQILLEGTKGVIAGWGHINVKSNSSLPNELYHMNVSIHNTSLLAEYIYCLAPDGDGQRSAAHGDSGGPFFLKEKNKWVIHGVASFIFAPCGNKDSGSGYTKVELYVDWINQWIQKSSSLSTNQTAL